MCARTSSSTWRPDRRRAPTPRPWYSVVPGLHACRDPESVVPRAGDQVSVEAGQTSRTDAQPVATAHGPTGTRTPCTRVQGKRRVVRTSTNQSDVRSPLHSGRLPGPAVHTTSENDTYIGVRIVVLPRMWNDALWCLGHAPFLPMAPGSPLAAVSSAKSEPLPELPNADGGRRIVAARVLRRVR